MSKTLAAALTLALAAWAAPGAQAATFTIEFSASGFQQGGVAAPGVGTNITGSMSWEALSPSDAIGNLTAFEMAINGHAYTLAEVGIANQGTTQTAFGGLVNGANAVVGNGLADDFLIVFDRLAPRMETFAFAVKGFVGSIWWTPTFTSMRYVDTNNNVPEPATALLVLAALGAAAAARRSRA
jgi:PEP-CTERM motif